VVPSSTKDWVAAIRATILSIPRGNVSTYADVAEAAGYPGYHRQVAQVLNRAGHGLPWHRVLGAGGLIKTSAETAFDQRTRLELEGVRFKGRRADMEHYAHRFPLKSNQRRS
jgi:methylated-DNA-protein-cysteine methyltransferase-like protein